MIVICPGRIESYVKYAELAYDLVHTGFDVLIIDHRGQGLSGRMLSDTHRGHVDNFSDYVDDLYVFRQQEVQPGPCGVSVISLRTQWAVRSPHCFCSARRAPVRCHCAHRADVWHRDAFSCTGWCVIFLTGLRAISAFVKGMPSGQDAGEHCRLPSMC